MQYPLTLPQLNIWRLQQALGGRSTALTMAAVFSAPCEEARLREAFAAAYAQSDALRLVVRSQGGEARQEFLPAQEPSLPLLEFRSLRAAERMIKKLSHTPAPEEGPLWRAYILRTGSAGLFHVKQRLSAADIAAGIQRNHNRLTESHNPQPPENRDSEPVVLGKPKRDLAEGPVRRGEKTIFVFHCSHLIADAWGLRLLAGRILAHLEGRDCGSFNYEDFAAAQQEYRLSERRERDFAYFERELMLCPRPVFLADKKSASLKARRISLTLPKELCERLSSAAEREGLTLYAMLLYAFGRVIGRRKGADKLFLGTTVLNRVGRRELETMGMFVNTVPILVEPSLDQAEGLRALSERVVGAFRHQRCGYTDLLARLREKYELEGGLYDVMLNFQSIRIEDNGVQPRWYFNGTQGETLQLHIHDWYGSGEYTIDYDYRTALLSKGDVKALHRELLRVLEGLCG
jgi:hypothetical protein